MNVKQADRRRGAGRHYNGPLAINVTLFDKIPCHPIKDLQPLTLAVKTPQYLVVNANTVRVIHLTVQGLAGT